jgi:phosphoglycolate phosphatase
MHIQAICFDLDGTLLDTLTDIGNAANAALLKFDLPTHPLESYRCFVGEGATRLMEQVLPQACASEKWCDQLLEAFEEEYTLSWQQHTCPYAGIANLLDELTQTTWPLTVLSNKPDAFTQQCVRHFLGGWPFEIVRGQRTGVPRKPDPAGIKLIAQDLGLPVEALCLVGDTSVDMQTAMNAGSYPVGVSWGFRKAEELREHGARLVVDSPAELEAWFRKQHAEFR